MKPTRTKKETKSITGVSVVMPTRNRLHALKKVLPTYLEQKEVLEVILILDGANDPSKAWLATLHEPKLIVLENDVPKGAPYSRNKGMRHARGEFILQTDDDVFLEKKHIATLLAHAPKSGLGIIAGRRIYLKHHETAEEARKRTEKTDRPLFDFHGFLMNTEYNPPADFETPFISATMLFPRSVFNTVQYDENLGGNAFREETDFQLSVLESGRKAILCPHAACFHLAREELVGGGQYERSQMNYQYWSIRNHFRFLGKHFETLNRLSNQSKGLWRWKLDFLWYTLKRPFRALARRLNMT